MGQRLLVIGGNGGGMTAAALARERHPDLEIVAIEKGRHTSYSSCGVPFLAAGGLAKAEELVVTTPDSYRAKRIDVRVEHEVVGLDLAARKAEVHNRAHGRDLVLGFDILHLATGARPRRPAVAGAELPHVHGVRTLDDATRLLEAFRAGDPAEAPKVTVIGSTYVGLEMAEAFYNRGAVVTVVEPAGEVMGERRDDQHLDADMGALVARAVRDRGIVVHTGAEVLEIDETAVRTTAGYVTTDLVVLGGGVEPDTALAVAGGLRTAPGGGIEVDRRQQTSAEGVWAAGDCCMSRHRISGTPTYQPHATVADQQGRVAGMNITGGYATFPGVLGTAVSRICAVEVGRTGLSERQAAAAGYEVAVVRVESTNRAEYLPEAQTVTVKLIAEKGSGRLLGAQIVGGRGSAKKIDTVAVAIVGGLSVGDLAAMDFGYAPAVGPLWDPLPLACRDLMSRL